MRESPRIVDAKARFAQRLAERRELRKCLPEILADVAALVGKEAATKTSFGAPTGRRPLLRLFPRKDHVPPISISRKMVKFC